MEERGPILGVLLYAAVEGRRTPLNDDGFCHIHGSVLDFAIRSYSRLLPELGLEASSVTMTIATMY